MYESPLTGDTYVIVTGGAGEVEQWKLDGSSGSVTATLARSFDVGSLCEGCVADDDLSDFYIGEEDSGIWKYGAEPGDGTTRTKVDSTGSGNLAADVEGLTIYYAADGKGYLLASSQGDNTYVVYEREGANAFVLKFSIESGNGLSGASNTDGIDVTAFGLGAAFPQGLFVAQDGGDENFKLVPWQSIAAAKTPPLTIDTSVDPRLVGSSSPGKLQGPPAPADQEGVERAASEPLPRIYLRHHYLDPEMPWATGLFEVKEHWGALALGMIFVYFMLRKSFQPAEERDKLFLYIPLCFLLNLMVWYKVIVGCYLTRLKGSWL